MEMLKRTLVDYEEPALSERQLAELKAILLEQQSRLMFASESGMDIVLDEEEKSDDVDHANADMSNFQKIRFRSRESFYQKKVTEALKRIEDDEFGFCEECGCNISYSRLLARPTAELCIMCKEEAEREEIMNQSYRPIHSSLGN
jgi:DnaK suppressor protein